MLLPLGILASSGGVSADYELISTTSGTGSSGVITFASIPSTYKHLQIRYTARSDRASIRSSAGLRFNSDTGSNYAHHRLYGYSSAVYSDGATSTQYAPDNLVYAAASATTGYHGTAIIDILDYASTSKNKTTRVFGGSPQAGDADIYLVSGLWMNTTAVTSITITDRWGANFTTTSRFSLYGLKG